MHPLVKKVAESTLKTALRAGKAVGYDLGKRLLTNEEFLAQVPGATFELRLPSRLVELRPPDYRYDDQEKGKYFRGLNKWGYEYRTKDAGLMVMPRGRFEFPKCALGANGRFLEEGFMFSDFPPHWAAHRYAFLFRARAELVEDGTMLPFLGYTNFFHWFIDILPRLQMLQGTEWEGKPVYLPKRLPRFAEDTLRQLPHDFRRLPDGYFEAERLCVPTRLSRLSLTSPDALGWDRRTFLGNAPVRGTRRLIVSRKDASWRALPQEDELAEKLEPFGFERVTLTGKSLEEQIALFQDAQIVTGAHGAGFLNVLWMPPGGVLLEITSDRHVGLSFWRMCNMLGLRHGFLEGTADDEGVTFSMERYLALLDRALADLTLP